MPSFVRTFLTQLLAPRTRIGPGTSDLGLSAAVTGAELLIDDAVEGSLFGMIEMSLEMASQTVVARKGAATFGTWS